MYRKDKLYLIEYTDLNQIIKLLTMNYKIVSRSHKYNVEDKLEWRTWESKELRNF
jgi:hypothetical protein